MALNSTRFRDAIKLQDAAAFVITLLGVAIAIFLPDSIVKLIGGSIALLGMVALYVTVKQRINDQIQLKTRRTTLPPPAFKTRVTQDPTSSTKRILFDDFKETFAPADDDPIESQGEGFKLTATVEPQEARATDESTEDDGIATPPPETQRPARSIVVPDGMPSFDGVEDEEEGPDEGYGSFSGESFRVVKPAKKDSRRSMPSIPTPTVTMEYPAAAAAVEQKSAPLDTLPAVELPAPRVAAQSASRQESDVAVAEEPHADTAPTRKQAQFILADLVSDGDEDLRGGEPRSEFVRLVGQVLNAIARSIKARSIVFFWVNFEKGHLIPEAKVTTGGYEIRSGARIALGNDVVSQIARSGVPEVITDISAATERELITYYTGVANTSSFVGVPVFFRREVVGVLAADSTDQSGFDEVSVATLAEYTRLISGLIRSYTEKYDLHLIARTLDSFEKMSREFSGTAPSPAHIADAMARQLAELFDHLYIAVVLFDGDRGEWNVAACVSEGMNDQVMALEPDMRQSLAGRATRFAEEVMVEYIGDELRIGHGESPNSGGTFLALPLVATTKCYGAVVVEHAASGAYIPRDVELMRDLTHYGAMAIEVFNTNRAIEAQVMLDEATGLYNADFLLATLDREMARSRDFRESLSLALISIDMPASLRAEQSVDVEDIITASVGAMVQSAVRPYDTVGRFNRELFGVVLVKRSDQDAYLWAEKLRKDVASRILAVGQRKSAVTISVGISDMSDHTSRDAMISGAHQALEKARSGEGNAVILY